MKEIQFLFSNEKSVYTSDPLPFGTVFEINIFESLNELNFVIFPSLSYRIFFEKVELSSRSFISHRDAQLNADAWQCFPGDAGKILLNTPGRIRIEIINDKPDRQFLISMAARIYTP